MRSSTARRKSVTWFSAGVVLATAVTMTFAQPWDAGAAPGDADSTFVPIVPCRLADSRVPPLRVGPAAAIGPAGTATFTTTGSNGNCVGIPSDATSLGLNVTALGATERTFLTFWPDGDRPLASSLNPAPGEPPTPNAVTVRLSDAGSFNVYNDRGTVNVVIDINGYYTPTSLRDIDARLQAFETALADVQVDVAALDAREPFVVSAVGVDTTVTNLTPVPAVTLTATAPTAGHMTVMTSSIVTDLTADAITGCSITTGTMVDSSYDQAHQTGSNGGAYSGGLGTLAGVRRYPTAAGQEFTFRLVCERFSLTGSATVSDIVMTALFTPS